MLPFAMLFGARRSRVEQQQAAPRGARRSWVIVAAAVLVVLSLGGGVTMTARGPVAGAEIAVTGTKELAALPDYGGNGSLVVRYVHGRSVNVHFALKNRGLAPITIDAIDPFPTVLGLLNVRRLTVNGQQLPVRLGAGQTGKVVVHAMFDHCAYFTEKAIDPYVGAQVRWRALGLSRTTQATYSDTLLVRSPTMLDCPGRVMDRSAKQRSEDATITGRG